LINALKERERVGKDSRRVKAKRKLWREARDTLFGGGREEQLLVIRFPGTARSSF
jgi:hypothetical protein